MRRVLPLALLLIMLACADTPTDLGTTGPVQVTVVAAATDFVVCGAVIPVTATVLNTRARPVPDFLLNFNVLSGGGSVFGGAALTDNKGIARDIWTIGSGANLSNTMAVRAVNSAGDGLTYFTQTVTTLSKIAYASQRNGNYEIYVMRPEALGVVTPLTTEGGADPAWSPDGSKIAFTRGGIYVMNATDADVTRLSGVGVDSDNAPAWSPDGKKIVFTSQRTGIYPAIYVMNADGLDQTPLTDHTTWDHSPAWSPDGSKIAFTRQHDNNYEIYVMRPDGTGQTRLTIDGGTEPAWSPDGRKIAFVRDGLYVMNADGTGVARLTQQNWNSPRTYFRPAWSPDGSQIAFEIYRPYDGIQYHEIAVINIDGSAETLLTTGQQQDMSPSWSGCVAP